MKNAIILVVLAVAGWGQAAYTYTYGPGTYFGAESLNGTESVMVNGGGGLLTLADHSTGRVEGTSPLAQYSGGIWEFQTAGYSSAVVTGGEFYRIYVNSGSSLTMSGGSVGGLAVTLSDIPAIPADKHIQFICKSWDYNSTTKTLSGVWGSDQPFSMLLGATPGYVDALQSINFTIVPEPLTLGLLAFGGLLARRCRRTGCCS